MTAWQFGPQLSSGGPTRFRLWAPDAIEQGCPVRLEVLGLGPRPMHECGNGWLEAQAPCGPGSRYWFRLDNGISVPDPASRAQAVDVHGASILCDANEYAWRNSEWLGSPLEDAVIHELDIGLHRSFADLLSHLPVLLARGYNAIVLKPPLHRSPAQELRHAPLLFAPERSYGCPHHLRALVDHAHGLGMMVLMDLIYDQFGCEDNHLFRYASSFFKRDESGNSINFLQPEVRRFFTENAMYWLTDFRMDGLRFHSLDRVAADSWIPELAATVRATFHNRRHVHLVCADA